MILSLLKRIPVWAWVCLVLGAYLGYLNMRLAHEQQEKIRYAFKADSAMAEADTTKIMMIQQGLFHVKRAIQMKQERDSVDRALRMERQAKLELVTRIRWLNDTLSGVHVPSPDSSTRVAEFNEYREPYTIKARATLPQVAPPTLAVEVRLDSIPLSLRLGCQKGDGIRTASVVAQGPTWASLRIAAVNQSPEICNPTVAPAARSPGARPYLIGAGAATGIFLIIKAVQ